MILCTATYWINWLVLIVFFGEDLGFSPYNITASARKDNLILFRFDCLLFPFLKSFSLGFPVLLWVLVVRMGTLILFLIFKEKLSTFHCWVRCLLWACYIWLFLGWCMFLLYQFVESFYHEKMLKFIKLFFSASTEMIVWFLSYSIKVIYRNYWFAYLESPLHLRNEYLLIMAYNLFNVLWNAVCLNFLENFGIYIH